MSKGFSFINILIIIGFIALAVLGYQEYQKNILRQSNNLTKRENNLSDLNNNSITSNTAKDITANNNGQNNTKNQQTNVSTNKSTSTNKTETKNITSTSSANKTVTKGFYKNNLYNYSISYPPSWPVKVYSDENVSIGATPPKNGLGAITVEVASQSNNEIEQAKAEANKYGGLIIIDEEPITLAGTAGTKLILTNTLARTTNIYILLKKYNLYYFIKYSEESSDFVNQVNNSLQTFKFTK